jgi:hypothetical protein
MASLVFIIYRYLLVTCKTVNGIHLQALDNYVNAERRHVKLQIYVCTVDYNLQRERPISTKPELSDTNKDVVWGVDTKNNCPTDPRS